LPSLEDAARTFGRLGIGAGTQVVAYDGGSSTCAVRRSWMLHVFVRRGLLPRANTRAIGQWPHGGGFSEDGSVRIEATGRAECERLLRGNFCGDP
jgi:hypothetical protein